MSAVYHIPQTYVKPLAKSGLTTADLNRLEDAGVSHAADGITHLFIRECDAPDCTGYYVLRITEDDPQWKDAIAHVTQDTALYCMACQRRKIVAAPNLLVYQPKLSAGGGGGNGGSHKAAPRPRRPRKPTAFETAQARLAAYGYSLIRHGKRYVVACGSEIIAVVGSIQAALNYLAQPTRKAVRKAVGR